MTFLGVDIGSSFIKGAVLDSAAMTISRVSRRPFPDQRPGLRPLFFEVDPQAATTAVREVVLELLPHAPGCRGVLFSGQMGGVILVDRHGVPLTNFISWRDQRATLPSPGGGDWVAEAARRIGGACLARAGNELRAGSAAVLLHWLAMQGQLPRGATPLSLCDYVVMHLCGSAAFAAPTHALGTLDLRTGDWQRELFNALEIGGLHWPALCDAWHPAGMFRTGAGVIPCYPPVGDHQCSLAGAMLADGELSINVSTGSQVSRLTPEPVLGDYQTRPYLDGRYLNTMTHLPAGRSLDVLTGLLVELAARLGQPIDNPWPAIVSAVENCPATDLACNLAFFAGPLGNRGAITNITTENLSVGALFRAAFESMAENYAACAARLAGAGAVQRVVFSGGLVQKLEPLRRCIAARFGVESRICRHTEDSLLGLLLMSLIVGGAAGDLTDAARLFCERTESAAASGAVS